LLPAISPAGRDPAGCLGSHTQAVLLANSAFGEILGS